MAILLVVAALLASSRRKRSGSSPLAERDTTEFRRRSAILLLVIFLLVAVPFYGWMGGWSLESLLMPVALLATGVVLVGGDWLLDRRLQGGHHKVVGPLPFWWTFVWAMALGWGLAMFKTDTSQWPTWVRAIVLVVLVLGSVAAFCFRFGLRVGR